MPEQPIRVEVPDDLTLSSETDLQTLQESVTSEFDALRDGENVDAQVLGRMEELAGNLDRIGSALAGRVAEREAADSRSRQAMEEQRARLATRVHGPGEPPVEAPPVDGGDGLSPAALEAVTAAAARGFGAAMFSVMGERARRNVTLEQVTERATSSLSAAQRHAPPVNTPAARPAMTAGIDIPGWGNGQALPDMAAVVDAVQKRAKNTPLTRMGPAVSAQGGAPAVTIRRQFEHTIDDRTSLAQVGDLVAHLTSRDRADALVAGGGWCAPSENIYSFFEIFDVDGIVDLPTVGISRGGIRFPTSPSLADVFINTPATGFGGFSATFGNQSMPWLWTETDDALTVTGTTNKPALRVPCASFNEERLECYGITVTAGNLADDAFPEATANFLRLVMAAHAHAMNGRLLALMASKSSSAITAADFGTATNPAFQQFAGGLSLAAVDYRARYGMAKTAVIEAVIPYWVASAIASDLAWRSGSGDDLLAVTVEQVNGYLTARGIRPQWVNDWQVRGSGQPGSGTALTNWPATADVMVYAAGTFVLGNGLSLDLGVVRDSVLNAENDHTAAWSEECHLVAKVGHESRLYRIQFNVNGGTNQTSPASAPYL